MPLTMHCDRVFDVLTRGPFPRQGAEATRVGLRDHGSSESESSESAVETRLPDEVEERLAVERHLAVCHECRALAEALRPGIELFHESLRESETLALPRYEGMPWSTRRSGTLPASAARGTSSGFLGSAAPWALVAAGLLMALWVVAGQAREPQAVRHGRPVQLVGLEATPDQRAQLDVLMNSAFCRPPRTLPGPTVVSDLAAWRTCCTLCHQASEPQRSWSPPATANLVLACQVCHST